MHIQKITINNFRCFEHLEVQLNPDINIFVGNNGSGKSALLDAIAASMYPYIAQFQSFSGKKKRHESPVFQRDLPVNPKGYKDKNQIDFFVSVTEFSDWTVTYKKTLKNESDAKINVSPLSEEKISSLRFKIRRKTEELKNDLKSQLSVLAYYPGNRHLTSLSEVKNIPNQSFDRFDALNHTLDATANFDDLVNWFFIREFQELREAKDSGDINFELPDLKQVRNAVSTIIQPSSRVYFSQATSAKLMVEWETETGEKKELFLSQLSSGYRNMLALVMDFARRLAQANPQMENPLEAEAILMIDELDLHLHPKWQQHIIPDLRKVFPNTQIIATTHSPEVLTTVDQHQVWILEDYQVKPCPSPTKGMKSSDVVRYVLGLEDLRPDIEEAHTFTRLFAAIDAGQLAEAKRLREELSDWDAFDADLTRADMQIRRLERKSRA